MSQISLLITINGVDVTDYVNLFKFRPQILSALDEELDTMTLTLENADGINPVEWQEIIVYDSSTRIFGGYVITVTQSAGSDPGLNNYVLGCSDYGILFNKIYYKGEFEAHTDAAIIADIFASTTEISGFDATTHVNPILTFPRARFSQKTVREILDWICQQTGGHWYMDYDKSLHYFGSEEYVAPFDVTDDPLDSSKKLVQNVSRTLNGAGVVNQVDVVGGSKISDDVTEYFTPTGGDKNLYLTKRYKPAATLTKIRVRRNDGGPTTNLIVNPSFEVNITDGWSQGQGGSGGAWFRDANNGAYGNYVLKITAGTNYVLLSTSGTISISPGESLSISALAWCTMIGKASLEIKNSSTYTTYVSASNTLSETWERIGATYKNNGTAAITVRVYLMNYADNYPTATPVYFDGIQAEKKSWPTDYCDGSRGTGYAWTGTANNSTSTRIDMPIWTTLTVKTGNVDTLVSSKDVLYYESTSRLEMLQNFPGLTNAIEVFGRYSLPMRVRMTNQASYDHYGKWLQLVVNAPEIVDKAVGVMRAKAELAANAFANIAISYSTRESGLRAGQTQYIRLPARHLDARYLIQRVATTIGIGGVPNNQVDLGAVDQSLVGFLLELKRASQAEIEWNENEIEVLDEVVDVTESITVTDAAPTVSESTGPYNWDAFNWDYGVWG